ncbi:MAG: hypothetical protein J5742_00770 [Alphaproteobacteria bacterium]|nr:hypothetical protein [Alphaproteobacteria bacterium]
MKKILLTSILAIVTGITIANADGDKKVTSKNYVDTQVATKQNTIPVAGTNLERTDTGSAVVTYTNTAGEIGQRTICFSDDDRCYSQDLVTVRKLNALPTVETSKMVCVDAPDCTLWSVVDQTVNGSCLTHGDQCGTMAECLALCCEGLTYNCFGANHTNCRCQDPNHTK